MFTFHICITIQIQVDYISIDLCPCSFYIQLARLAIFASVAVESIGITFLHPKLVVSNCLIYIYNLINYYFYFFLFIFNLFEEESSVCFSGKFRENSRFVLLLIISQEFNTNCSCTTTSVNFSLYYYFSTFRRIFTSLL